MGKTNGNGVEMEQANVREKYFLLMNRQTYPKAKKWQKRIGRRSKKLMAKFKASYELSGYIQSRLTRAKVKNSSRKTGLLLFVFMQPIKGCYYYSS